MSNNILDSVRSFLDSNYMFTDEEWLSGCIEFLTDSIGNNIEEIQNNAKEQWLLNNLTDICPGSLPKNLKLLPKTNLTGHFILQVNAVVDIGSPAYQQYLTLQKINTENVDATTKFDDKIPNHRMIKLYMTDGIQEISGIEYRPMRNLSLDITPGCKVLIKGPVECRRGVILLTESSIEMVGGEVQEMLISNSQVRLLSDKLGLPISQESNPDTTLNYQRNTNIPTPHTQMPPSVNDKSIEESTNDQPSRPVARVTSIQKANFIDDDINTEELMAIEARCSESLGKRLLDDDIQQPEKKKKINPTTSTDPPKLSEDDYLDYMDISFEDADHLKEMEAKFDAVENELCATAPKEPVSVSSEPFVYIKQINDLDESDKLGKVFKVKGQILKLLSKLKMSEVKDRWILRGMIVDGSGSMVVDFTSDVLSQLIELTPHEMNQIKKEIKSKPELKEKAIAALQKAKDHLQVLYCIIELTMLETPTITQLVPFDKHHRDLIQNRLQSSGL